MLARAAAGDDRAFGALVRHYDRPLRMLTSRLLRDRQRMDDVLQEAYLRAYKALAQFRGGARPATWLYRIVYNTCLKDMRRHERAETAHVDILEVWADPGSARGEAGTGHIALDRALAGLPVDQRAIVLIVDADGFDHVNAAAVFGVATGTIASRLARARALLWTAHGDGSSRTEVPEAGQLGVALRTLPVPDHAPGFWEVLSRRLLAERGGRRRSGSEEPSRGVQGQTHRIPTAPERQPPARPGPRPATVGSVRRADVGRRRRRPRLALIVVLVAFAAAALAVSRSRSSTAAVTAGEVADKMATTLSLATTLQGTVTLTAFDAGGNPLSTSYAFLRTENGSFRVRQSDGTYDAGYDAATGTRRQVSTYLGRVTDLEEMGMPPAGPDPAPPVGCRPSASLTISAPW